MKKHPKMNYIYIGVDCHKHTHTASIINCFNENLGTVTFNNETKGFTQLIKLVEKVQIEYKEQIPVFGLEDTKHFGRSLCTFLLSKNYLVKYVNASLTFSARKDNPIITKTDEIDSLCIAKVLLDKFDLLPIAKNDEIFWTLKQLVVMRRSLTVSHTHYLNKLHSQLIHHYPNYQKMFSYLDSKTSIIFFNKFPSPNMLNGITKEKLADEIKLPSGKGRHKTTAEKIIKLVSEYEPENTNYQEERNYLIKLLIKQLQNTNDRIEEIEKEIIDIYDKIGYKLHTLKCLNKVTAADIIAEIGNIERFNSSSQLARYAGVAPNQFSSGNTTKYVNNKYGNRTLHTFIYFLAVRSICPSKTGETPLNAIFIEYFNKKVSEGKTRKQALTCVMRRLINIIYGVLKNNEEYKHPSELEQHYKEQYLIRRQEEKIKEAETLHDSQII